MRASRCSRCDLSGLRSCGGDCRRAGCTVQLRHGIIRGPDGIVTFEGQVMTNYDFVLSEYRPDLPDFIDPSIRSLLGRRSVLEAVVREDLEGAGEPSGPPQAALAGPRSVPVLRLALQPHSVLDRSADVQPSLDYSSDLKLYHDR
ncbi:hypothetical protein M758_5G186000 [Ceratodon purpureus]|nr:hypothetical protein M758_5G186000 [Ceratodon purpureus]